MSEGRARGRWIWIVAGALVVVVAGLMLGLKAVFTPERLRTEIARLGESALGLPVEVGGAKLSLLPPAVELERVRIAADTPDAPTLLSLESGRARLAWAPLLRGRLVVRELRFDRPDVALRRDGAGIVLPGKLGGAPAGPAPPAPGGPPPPPTVIERLEIVGGRMRLAGAGPLGEVNVEGIDLTARLELTEGGDRLLTAGELQLANLSLTALEAWRRTLDALSPSVRFDLEYRASAGRLALTSVRMVAGPLDVGGSGELTGLPAAPHLSFEVEPTTVSLEELLPLIPSSLIPEGRAPRASGPVRIAARIDGPLGDPARPPSFALDLGFDGAELGMEGFPLGLREVRGDVAVADTAIAFRALTASLGEGSLRVDGRVAGARAADSGRVDLDVKAALDLALLKQGGFVPEEAEMAGKIDADVALHGRATAPEAADLRGTVALAGGRIAMPDMPVPMTDLGGRLVLEGASATLQEVSGALGRSTFRGEGRVDRVLRDPFVTLRGTCPLLDLTELAPPPPVAPGEGVAAPGQGGAGQGAGGAATSLPALVPELPPIRARLDLAVDSLVAPNTTAAGAELAADLAEGRATLRTTIARAHFSEEGITLHDVTGEGTMANGRLDATFRAPKAEAYRVPLSTIDGKIEVEGRRVDVKDVRAGLFTGRIEGDAVMDLANPLEPSFVIDSRAADVQANDFLASFTPAKDVLHGKLDLSSHFEGKGLDPMAIAQSLVASGTMDAREGRLARGAQTQAIWNALRLGGKEAIDFRELTAPFSIRGGKLITEKLELGSPEAKWRASGALGFDGKLDYRVQVELGDALASEFRQRAGSDLAAMLAGSSGKITLDLQVGGTTKSPQVTLDTAALADRMKDNLARKAQGELKSAKDKLLERLIPPAGGDTAAATDSAKAPPKLEDALRDLFKKGK